MFIEPILRGLVDFASLIIRDRQIVQTTVTDRVVRRQHPLVGNREFIRFECREFKHEIISNKWYIGPKTKYTYEVRLYAITAGAEVREYILHYPNLGNRYHVGTTIPYLMAISASVDWLLGRKRDENIKPEVS